jgi:hypothetical protein
MTSRNPMRIPESLLGCLLAFLLLAPAADANAAPGPTSTAPAKSTFGAEFDVLALVNDGYYISLFAGGGHVRGRAVYTHLTVPGFATDDDFEDNDLSVVAGILDIYFKDGFTGWWVGPGLEGWEGKVTEKSSGLRQTYQTTMFTVGGGYTWKFSDHFYLNPWAAIHVPIAGDRDISFASSVFEINTTPEVSVKLGIVF